MALVDDIARDIRQLFPKAPDESIRLAIVRAARAFCSQTRWYVVAQTATLVANTRSYALGGDPLLEVVDVSIVQLTLLPAGPIVALQRSDPRLFDPNLKPSQPQRFAYLPEGTVSFDPIPNAAYPVTMTLAVQPRDGVAEIPDPLLVKWRYAIEDGAAAFLFELPEPWNNPALAERKRLAFVSAINNAKADAARAWQGGSFVGPRRSFIVG